MANEFSCVWSLVFVHSTHQIMVAIVSCSHLMVDISLYHGSHFIRSAEEPHQNSSNTNVTSTFSWAFRMTAASMYQAWMGVNMKSWRKVRCWEVHQCRLWPIRICGVILHYLMLPIQSYTYHWIMDLFALIQSTSTGSLYFSCLENGCLVPIPMHQPGSTL